MQAMTPDRLVDQLLWRYAAKKFDPARVIPPPEWAALEATLVLTPSSFGLQPWRFVVVTDREIKARLASASWGQRQPADCSHMVVLARREDLSEADVDRFLDRTAEIRGTGAEKLAGYRKVILKFRQQAESGGWLNAWADRQVYIALGTFMTAAAVLGVDTCPMEGIETATYNEILGLRAIGFATVVGCAAGYRAADDRYSTVPKVRFAAADVIQRI